MVHKVEVAHLLEQALVCCINRQNPNLSYRQIGGIIDRDPICHCKSESLCRVAFCQRNFQELVAVENAGYMEQFLCPETPRIPERVQHLVSCYRGKDYPKFSCHIIFSQ